MQRNKGSTMAYESGADVPFFNQHITEQPLPPSEHAVIATALDASKMEIPQTPVYPSPSNMYPGMAQASAAHASAEKDRQTVASERLEAIRVLDKDAFKLGDLNPLIHPLDLGRKESVDAVRHTIANKIEQYDGMMPKVLESAVVTDLETGNAELRFIARFEIPNLTEEQLQLLEEVVEHTYTGVSVRTRTDSKGNDIPLSNYPPTQPGEELKSKTGGWYMGSMPVPTSGLHQGLYVFKDQGPISKDNFFDDNETIRRYIVEVREASQYQTDLVTFVTEVASVLGQSKLLDRGQLLYETYYDLIRLGLKGADTESIYGMDEAADKIRRELILPLANPDISQGVGADPQSVLMIGVPGTGKTLVVERELQKDTGLFILPIDPFELQRELAKPKEKQYLMPRIAEIARITGKRVVMHVDDIENMITEHEVTNSTMLNLMAGVQESGFYMIASSNYPEKINPSLIQPQRFSVLIHCGLQNEKARYEILKIHANLTSKRLGHDLFGSEELRDIILQQVARHTEAFTPRYLANIATIAKSHLVNRVAGELDKTIGLTEEDLEGHTFIPQDWELAFAEVSAKYDSQSVKDRDKELSEYVKKHTFRTAGFTPGGIAVTSMLFPPDVQTKIAAAQAKVVEPDSQ